MPVGRPRSQMVLALDDQETLSIRDLYRRLDRALRSAVPGEVWITGEVRSVTVSSKGLCYLELVDPVHGRVNSSPVVKAVCWSRRWATLRAALTRLGILLEAGMVVRVRGSVQLYQPRAEISFVLSDLDIDALVGKVAAERARLVQALVEEGLFERNRRIPVPPVPLEIGLVASPGTEGYRDFIGCLEMSGMAFAVRALPTQVQGRAASRSVAAALRRHQAAGCDLIAVVRGGGSKVDLAVFDAEPVARAVATCPIPVWTGIGHTGDQSVADQVANRSFRTPTECGRELAALVTDFWRTRVECGARVHRLAGEQVARSEHGLDRHRQRVIVGTRSQLGRHSDRLAHHTRVLRGSAKGGVDGHRQRLEAAGLLLARSARRALASEVAALSARTGRMATLPGRRLDGEEGRSGQWRRLLGAYDFQRQLERGYSVTRDESGRVVRSAGELAAGSRLFTRLADGSAVSEVIEASSGDAPDGARRDVDDPGGTR